MFLFMTYDTETEGKRQVIFYLCYSSLLYTISEGSQQFATAEIGTVGIDDGFRLLQVEFVLLIHIFFIGMYCQHQLISIQPQILDCHYFAFPC